MRGVVRDELQTCTDLHVRVRFIQNTSLFLLLLFLLAFFSWRVFLTSVNRDHVRFQTREGGGGRETRASRRGIIVARRHRDDRLAEIGNEAHDCGFAFFMRLRLRVGGE